MNSLELCAGAGGQAQGLERAGFEHQALVEIDTAACSTLRLNRPQWNVIEGDLAQFDAHPYREVDLVTRVTCSRRRSALSMKCARKR